MCSKSSSHVITPGVESGSTNAGHCAHFGYAPTSLHMSSQMPDNLFCTCVLIFESAAMHACSVIVDFIDTAANFTCFCKRGRLLVPALDR